MQIKNVTTGQIIISDLPGAQGGSGLSISADQTVTIFDEDAERSTQLQSLISAGSIQIIGADEPATGTSVGGTPAADVTADLQANAAAAAAAQADIDLIADSGVLKSPRLMSADPNVGVSVFPFTPAIGAAGRIKKTYVAEIPGFEFEFESFEGMGPRLQGSLATGRMLGGLPYTTTRYTKAQRAAIPALVANGLVNIGRATVGTNPQIVGANYLPDFDVNGSVTKSALQKAHDDMEANGNAILIEIRGGYFGDFAGLLPHLSVTKNFRIMGAFGNGATSTFSQNTSLFTIFGNTGLPAIRVTKLTPGVVTLFLSNLRVQGFDAPAIELVGNVALRANNCMFDTTNDVSEDPFPTIRMQTTGGTISILTDCHMHNSTGGGDCVTYEGAGGTNWIRFDRGSHRLDSGGSFLNVIDGFASFQLNGAVIDLFSPGFVVKNTLGSPISVGVAQSISGPVSDFDANVTVNHAGEL